MSRKSIILWSEYSDIPCFISQISVWEDLWKQPLAAKEEMVWLLWSTSESLDLAEKEPNAKSWRTLITHQPERKGRRVRVCVNGFFSAEVEEVG